MAEQASSPLSRHRRWSPRGDRGLKARWPFIFLTALAAVSLLLHAVKWRRQLEVQGLSDQWAALAAARPAEAAMARRARFYQIRYFLGYPMAVSYAAADLVRRVDALAPPLRLLAVQVEPGLHGLGFELRAGIEAAGPRAARRKVESFMGRLGNLSRISEAEYAPAPRAAGESGLRVFVVKGRADLQ
jgi:hypothetical protein